MPALIRRTVLGRMFLLMIVGGAFLLYSAPIQGQKKHPAEGKARSLKSDIETSIEFYNQGQDVIKVFWLNLEGKRENGKTLNPGDRVTLKTFLNHAWVLTDEKENALGLYYPDADKRVVTYGEAKANPFGGFGKGGGGFQPGPGGKGGGFGGFQPGPGGKGKKGTAATVAKIVYVQDTSALAELKLTADQTAKVKALDAKNKEDLQALAQQGLTALQRTRKTLELRQELDRDVANLLEPAQNKRLEQMMRQDLGSGLFTEKTLVDALQFTPEQRVKLTAVKSQFNTLHSDALRADPKGDAEFVKKLVQARKTAFDATKAMLAADQKAIWNELVGDPWNGYIRGSGLGVDPGGFGKGGPLVSGALRTRAYDFNNWSASNARFLTEKSVQEALKMTNDQIAKIPAFGMAANDVLTLAQLKQYQGIYLQQSMTAYGPAGKFRYREVQDLLNLTDAQKTKILAIGQTDARAYADLLIGGTPPAPDAVKKFDKTTDAKLDEVLTADQRAKLKGLIGETFTGAIQSPFGSPTFTKGGDRPEFGKGKKKGAAPLP